MLSEILLRLDHFHHPPCKQQRNFKEILKINSKPINNLHIYITCLLSLVKDIEKVSFFNKIHEILKNENIIKLNDFIKKSENVKLKLLQGLKNINNFHKKVKKCLEIKNKMALQRMLFQEFIHKIELKVCVTNLNSRKGYIIMNLDKNDKNQS